MQKLQEGMDDVGKMWKLHRVSREMQERETVSICAYAYACVCVCVCARVRVCIFSLGFGVKACAWYSAVRRALQRISPRHQLGWKQT